MGIARDPVARFEHLGVQVHGRRIFLLRQVLNRFQRPIGAAVGLNLFDHQIVGGAAFLRRGVEDAMEQAEIDGNRCDRLDRLAVLPARLEDPLGNRLLSAVVQPETDGTDGRNARGQAVLVHDDFQHRGALNKSAAGLLRIPRIDLVNHLRRGHAGAGPINIGGIVCRESVADRSGKQEEKEAVPHFCQYYAPVSSDFQCR
jgi:hypothetical protein